MRVDPKNRLVADSLEANWNERLRALAEAQEQYERQRQADRTMLDQESQSRILALTTDFRQVIGEAVSRHMGNQNLAAVFPGYGIWRWSAGG